MSMRKVVYLSGPIRDEDLFQVARNLRRFHDFHALLIHWGFAVVNPAIDWAALGSGPRLTVDELLDNDRALIQASDVVLQLRGWERSKGATIEQVWALEFGVPCVPETGKVSTQLALYDALGTTALGPKRPR